MSRLVRFPPFPPSPPPVVIVQRGRCHVHICCPSSLISPGPLPPPPLYAYLQQQPSSPLDVGSSVGSGRGLQPPGLGWKAGE